MTIYRACACNDAGLTFRFTFYAHNWNGIDQVARRRLDEIVAGDPLHQKYGPWSIRGIDIGA